jgi:hypothetical protein
MRLSGAAGARRLSLGFATIAALATSGVGQAGIANAAPATFDDAGYSACTATNVPGPGQDFDGVVTACCLQYAGIPTPTAYGMGCTAGPSDNMPADYRPTILLPTRPMPDSPLSDGDLLDPPIEGLGPPVEGITPPVDGMSPPVDAPSP